MILVVADTGPVQYLILLDAINVLSRLFDRLILPSAVYDELMHPRAPAAVRRWLTPLPTWVEVKRPASGSPIGRLHRGESEAIALAMELKPAVVLLDEAEARQEAMRLGLAVSGTVGVLEKAAQRGLLDLRTCLDRLLRTTFRIDKAVILEVLARNSPPAGDK